MKKATLEATDENILQSIKEQKGTERNTEIMEFIKALDLIEENIFISLDARWGEGKTFYVRQIEKTLEYQTLKNFETDDNKNKYEEMKPYFEKTVLEDIELGNSYLPVYYNAWLYDNHSDPLMSLLYVIIKKCGLWIDSKLVKDKTDKLKDIIKSIQVNLGIFSINGDKVIDAVSEKNIFDGIQLAEDIRQRVKEIFNQVIEGQTQKLVIFIDELDRCKPSYALEMLERIKHYFDDNRIIFIVSVNKEQLTHTISNYYGNGFDSTGYLNKFFDVNAYLPEVERRQLRFVSEYSERSIFGRMANMYANYYKLTLRDALIYKERLSIIDTTENSYVIDDDSIEGVCISIFVPLIVILDMVDIKEKVSFIDDSNLLSILKQGIAELAKEDYIRIIKDLKNEYIIDFEKLYLDTEKDYFVKMFVEEIQQILLLEESIKKKMSLLKYFIVICSTFNWSKDMGKYQGKISGMSLEYFADLTGISSKTCNRYNIILEKNHLLFVYRSNDKMKNFDGTMRQINNCYSRYCDKELCIAYATDYENRYGYEHKIVQTRKNKEEADKNRRLAAIYNRICEGHEYPIEVVREVQKYIRNKNQYLQKLIDEKKAQSYMAFSEKEWVARLESQLRDESVFLQAKLESDCEFESNIWGEPNPLDIFIEEAV